MTAHIDSIGSVALVTGGSRGLGLALTRALVEQGWRVVVDGRDEGALAAVGDLGASVVVRPGDVTDAGHRRDLAAVVADLGRLDLLVNNASDLGPSPLPALADLPVDALRRVLEVNVVAPLALIQEVLPLLRSSRGTVVDLSSDAAVQAYAGWGGYGASKAALDHLTRVLAAEEPQVRALAVDPGDMRTRMHADAFPGEDISDRPLPEDVVPVLLRLLRSDRRSGRYALAELAAGEHGADRVLADPVGPVA